MVFRLILTEETLSHLPIPTFGGADALNDASGLEVGKMLLDGFGRDAYLCCKSSGTQRTIFCQQGDDFLPTFFCKYDLFSLLFGRQGRGRECTIS